MQLQSCIFIHDLAVLRRCIHFKQAVGLYGCRAAILEIYLFFGAECAGSRIFCKHCLVIGNQEYAAHHEIHNYMSLSI